ncbi:MAG: hypothetical protein P4L22_06720 [Candidatus Babeliales bacterium]|nr:hypothetical protein [Candidatus Babeliales bacterium]
MKKLCLFISFLSSVAFNLTAFDNIIELKAIKAILQKKIASNQSIDIDILLRLIGQNNSSIEQGADINNYYTSDILPLRNKSALGGTRIKAAKKGAEFYETATEEVKLTKLVSILEEIRQWIKDEYPNDAQEIISDSKFLSLGSSSVSNKSSQDSSAVSSSSSSASQNIYDYKPRYSLGLSLMALSLGGILHKLLQKEEFRKKYPKADLASKGLFCLSAISGAYSASKTLLKRNKVQ